MSFLRRIMERAMGDDLPDAADQIYTALSCDDCLSEINIARGSFPPVYILRVLHDETCPSLALGCSCDDGDD